MLLVIAASAYFILGVGQPNKQSTSLPAVTASATPQSPEPLEQVAPPSPDAQEEPTVSGSSNFGELGGESQPTATSSTIDTLRQRQQSGR